MKFTESLSQGLVPEWRNQYVEYKAGKKIIKKIVSVQNSLDANSEPDENNNNDKKDTNDRTPLLQPNSNNITGYNQDGPFSLDADSEFNDHSPKQRPLAPLAPLGLLGSHRSQTHQATPQGPHESHNLPENPQETPTHLAKRSNMSFKTSFFGSSAKTPQQRIHIIENEKNEFKIWLNSELSKVEAFYKDKEQEVYERFLVLEDQLYQLKEHRVSVIKDRNNHIRNLRSEGLKDADMYKRVNELAFHTKSALSSLNKYDLPSLPSTVFLKKLKGGKSNHKDSSVPMTESLPNEFDANYFENRIRNGMLPDKGDSSSIDSESLNNDGLSTIQSANNNYFEGMANSSSFEQHQQQQQHQYPQTTEMITKRRKRDYVSKKRSFGVPFLHARKQLKGAMLEHYRSLMLLRSYRVLNRTAFRKITKKYDKLTKSNISSDYMKMLDKEVYFLTSDVLDNLVFQTEELYISFFDPDSTDRKQSLEKLKSIAYALNNSELKLSSYYSEFFSAGLCIGISIPLFILGIYTGLYRILNDEFPEGVYLFQIYGGFFLLNLMILLFGADLIVFNQFNINYKFIFELNIADALDYKQFWVLPSCSFALLSILTWFSMNDFWNHEFPGRDWPWIYFAVMIIIFMWPFNQFYLSSRRWLQNALWRILLSGFYPVEFRDFFLGDLLCSLTYTMGNISFFFCLYANHWNGIVSGDSTNNRCGSSKSRSMGFFSSLPSIFRFLQCVRRYTDTGDWFPHLANMVKYGITTLYYCLLSVYRIDRTGQNRAVFIAFATINSLYTSTWDIVMDWSLLQVGSKNWLLRDNLFYKNPMYYYIAMVSDVLLRFQWIFYAFFSAQIQQLAATSFLIAFAEILRRIIWVLFRMENEHCTNVTLFRASKDTPLPYSVPIKVELAIKKLVRLKYKNIGDLSSVDLLSSLFELPPPGRNVSQSDTESIVGFNNQIKPPPAPYFATTRLYNPPTSSINGVDANDNGATATGSNRITPVEVKPRVSRRKSTLATFSEVLNKAHIKDFQRKKNIAFDEESDEEEEEDDDDDDIKEMNSDRHVDSTRDGS